MSELTTRKRNALRPNQFAGPNRTYPIPDKSHAINAKARARQAVEGGRMTKDEEQTIDQLADAVIESSK